MKKKNPHVTKRFKTRWPSLILVDGNGCDGCGFPPLPGRTHHTIRVTYERVCEECGQLPHFKLICKSTAKKRFCLSDKDINELSPTWRVPNPHYRSSADMILMKVETAHKAALDKYGGQEGLDERLSRKKS